MSSTAEQVKASLNAVFVLGGAIRELRQIPSGHMYAMVMAFLSLEQYEQAVSILVNAKAIRRKGDVLVWCAEETAETE